MLLLNVVLTLSEFLMKELLPLYRLHEAIFEFCRGRADLIIFGAQAVNVYVAEPRMTQDVDIFSLTPKQTAEELGAKMHQAFRVAVRVCEIAGGKAYRVYQLREEGNRHLADVRLAEFSLDDAID